MANRMEKNSMQTHRFNLKSIVETLKKLVGSSLTVCFGVSFRPIFRCFWLHAPTHATLAPVVPCFDQCYFPAHPFFFCAAVRVLHDSCRSGRGCWGSGQSQRARGEKSAAWLPPIPSNPVVLMVHARQQETAIKGPVLSCLKYLLLFERELVLFARPQVLFVLGGPLCNF